MERPTRSDLFFFIGLALLLGAIGGAIVHSALLLLQGALGL